MTTERSKESFVLVLNGQIDSAKFESTNNLYCKYSFVYGIDWNQISGLEEAVSAHCDCGSNVDQIITIGMPIYATFTSTNPYGWPQIVLSCYGDDSFGNDVIRGYGAVHLPTVPGRSSRQVPMFVPEASTTLQRFIGWITGRRAEYVDAKVVASADSRHVTRVRTQGMITVTMDVVLKDMKKFGYDVCRETVQQLSTCPLPDFDSFYDQQHQNRKCGKDEAKQGGAIKPWKSDESKTEQQATPSTSTLQPSAPPVSTVRPLPVPQIKRSMNIEENQSTDTTDETDH